MIAAIGRPVRMAAKAENEQKCTGRLQRAGHNDLLWNPLLMAAPPNKHLSGWCTAQYGQEEERRICFGPVTRS